MADTNETTDLTGPNEQMFKNILAACPVGLCQLEDRKFKWVNHAMVKMFGFESETDFLGKSTRMMYASQGQYRRVGATLYQSVRGCTELEADAKLVRKDGSVFDGCIRISGPDPSNLMKGTIVAITDRTPLRKAEAAIAESDRRFREILENVRLVAVCLNMESKITFCNDFLLEITDWKREEVLGRSWFDIFASPKHDNQRCRSWHMPPAYDEARREKVCEIVTRSGQSRCIRWNTTVFLRDSHRNPLGVASIGEDITERKQAHALLLHTERIKAVGEMAGGVAHNFNNLLQVIMGASQIAVSHLTRSNMSQVSDELARIVKACDMGAQTIKRLQEFARLRGEESTDSDFATVDLSFTVRQAVEMTLPWWRTNPEKEGIVVSLDAHLEPGCLVNGKENELFEVTVNLIKNAAEACPHGGNIKVSTFVVEDQVVFQIQDDGIGIAEANIGKVFQPFWTTKGFRGTGMGLSSSYGIVGRHRGEMSVESAEGRGTTFTVRLPRVYRETDAIPHVRHAMPGIKIRILLVDDVEALLHTLEDGLTLCGYKVFTATSGHEAVAIFNREIVDVVICDLGMEGMNGREVSRSLEAACVHKGIPKVPFILLTGWGGQISDTDGTDRSSIDRILAKPVSISHLLDVLAELVEEHKERISPRLVWRNGSDNP
jgi:two-component system, cell cycle sensor histidine kinase and response regulator CckA